jgi:hypothetical protein
MAPGSREWIGLRGSSFATFVSKNAASVSERCVGGRLGDLRFGRSIVLWKNHSRSSRWEWQRRLGGGALRQWCARSWPKLDALATRFDSRGLVWIATAVFRVSLSRRAAVSAVAAVALRPSIVLSARQACANFAFLGASAGRQPLLSD